MKQRTKLLIAFFISIFMPLVLTAAAFFGLLTMRMNELQKNYGVEVTDYNYLTNTVQLLNRYTQVDYDKLRASAQTQPVHLEDRTYLDEINAGLEKKSSYLVVRRGEEIFYRGNTASSPDDMDILQQLPDYVGDVADNEMGVYLTNKEHKLIKQVDFLFSDGQQGSAFIITNVARTIPELRDMCIDMLISVVLILVLTAGMLAIWIYNGMITPVKRLQLATKNIMEDNLDFTIEAESEDEIGELCNNFEEMRKKLKEYSEERLLHERESRELISNISHDLKTPLTAIRGYVEGLIDGVADTREKKEHYCRTILNKTNEMTRLLNELTLYSQIDTNRIPYNFNKLNVADYFGNYVDDLVVELEEKNVTIRYEDFAQRDIIIIADPKQLARVMTNIISNTLKYLDKPEGKIDIRIRDVGDFVQVEIEDNGRGIATKDLPYIFDRFYRADASRNSATGGSGIGLSIVKKIIEDHGGKIWASSKEGIGTVMYFVLRKYQEVPYEENTDH